MKKLVIILAALFGFGTGLSVFAQSSTKGTSTQEIIFIKTTSGSPRPPLRSSPIVPVTGMYEDGVIEISFLQDVGPVTVTFDGATYFLQGQAGSTESIYVGDLEPGGHEIEISSTNASYTGYVY